MAIVLPVTGSLNWDVTLDAALNTLQNQINSGPPNGAAGGDLGGSYPTPLVLKVNGTSVPAAPTSGQVIVATSGSTATWQTPPASPPNGAASGDLGGSYPAPTVTATHLSAPLPIAQGGTASSTAAAARTALGLSVEAVPGGQHFNVKDYGALGDGSTDDLAHINSAIAAAAAVTGGIVFFPPGVYVISNSIVLTTGVSIEGSHYTGWVNRFATSLCSIKPNNTFAGECAISMLGAEITLSGHNEGNCRISNIDIDGSALPAGSVSGIHAQGEVMDVVLTHVTLKNFTHNGIQTNIGSGTKAPHDWYFDSVVAYQNAGFGFSLSMTDGYFRNCIATTNTGDGWLLGPFGSLSFSGCQALFNSGNGMTINGGSQVGNLTIDGFVTDRNNHDGIHLGPSSGTGSPPFILSNITVNRDGSNGGSGGGGYSGIAINGCANPVIIEGIICNTGVNDDTTGTNSPQYGITLSGNAYVAVGSGYVHGNTTGWNDDGTNTIVRRGINIGEATGLKTAPTFVYTNGVSTVNGDINASGNIVASGRALGIATPQISNGFAAWTHDPQLLGGNSTAGTSGTVYLSAVEINVASTITKAYYYLGAGATTPTAAQNFVGVYNSAGTLVGSQDITTAITGATGPIIATFTTPFAVTPGRYYVAFLFNGGTPNAALARQAANNVTAANINRSGANLRIATGPTTQTSLPSTITMSSNVGTNAFAFWAAIA